MNEYSVIEDFKNSVMKNLKFVLTSTIIVLFLGISFQSCNKSELDGVMNPSEAVMEKDWDDTDDRIIIKPTKP